MSDLPAGVWMAQSGDGTPIVVRAEVEDARRAAEEAFRRTGLERAPFDFDVDRFDWRVTGEGREVLWALGEGDELATGYAVTRWELEPQTAG